MTALLILVHDVGTTSSKSCLYRLGDRLEIVETVIEDYPLYVLDNGGIEQDPDQWWVAIGRGTQAVLRRAQVAPEAVAGMAFCAQMQGFVPVDADGHALCRAMSYMDARGTAQRRRYLQDGLLKIEGMNALKLITALRITGGASASAKDPLWKYLWLREERPDLFQAMRYWLDVKDYLVMRCTGEFTFGYDSAHATFLFDTRPNQLRWHAGLCETYNVDINHLPPVVRATDQVGGLTAQAAQALGLPVGLPVFGGGGDLTLISLGAGCLDTNSTHIYIGTSGWVGATVDKRMTDINGMVASILGAIPGKYNYISEQETSGRCLQWIRDHLALDEIGVYLEQQTIADREAEYRSLYDYLGKVVEETAPGANGVIFTPWLHGNRSPFEDPYARGMFFNLNLQTGKREMIRAVLEGDAYHKRWMLETVEKNVPYSATVRFVGGGARSDTWGQILADITGRTIEVTEHPENAGAAGAALVCGVGLGAIQFADIRRIVQVAKTFTPRAQYRALYDKQYAVFRQLHKRNKALFKALNATAEDARLMTKADYPVYGYRWVVLAVFMAVNLTIQILWISYAPVTSLAAQVYSVSDLEIGLLAMSFMLAFIPFSIPASWVIDTSGFRFGVGIGVVLMSIGGLLRGFAGTDYAVVLLATIAIAVAQPFLLNAWTKVPANWFAVEERATAVGLVTLANLVGTAIGMVLTPVLSETLALPTIQLLYGGVAAFSAVLFLVFAREKPPTPPCAPDQAVRALMLNGLKHALHSRMFLLVLLVSFVGLGIFNGINTWIEGIVQGRGFSPTDAGTLGALMLVGAVIIPALSDRQRKRQRYLLLGIVLTIPGVIGLTFATEFWLLLVSAFALGFFLVSTMPIAMQYAAEITYPTPEGTSNGLIQLFGQASVIFVFIMSVLKTPDDSFTPSLLLAIGLLVLCAGVITRLRDPE